MHTNYKLIWRTC